MIPSARHELPAEAWLASTGLRSEGWRGGHHRRLIHLELAHELPTIVAQVVDARRLAERVDTIQRRGHAGREAGRVDVADPPARDRCGHGRVPGHLPRIPDLSSNSHGAEHE